MDTGQHPEVVTQRWRTGLSDAHTPALPMAPDNLLEAAQVLSSRSHTLLVQFGDSGLNRTVFFLLQSFVLFT